MEIFHNQAFAFTIAENGDEWSTDEEGNDIRTITKIDRLFDVSPIVTYPAYNQAESDLVVAQRALAMYKENKEIKEEENRFGCAFVGAIKDRINKTKK